MVATLGVQEPMGWSLLHELRGRMEEAYSGWFIEWPGFGLGCREYRGGAACCTNGGQPGRAPPGRVLRRHVAQGFGGGGPKRVYVVISDAFRFEAKQRPGPQELNSRNRVKARLEAMLDVLAFHTRELTWAWPACYAPQGGLHEQAALDILMDGMPTATVRQRQRCFSKHGGVAIGRDDLVEKARTKAVDSSNRTSWLLRVPRPH